MSNFFIMKNLPFQSIPPSYEKMKNQIQDSVLQNMYSKFIFFYYPLSSIYENEKDNINIENFLLKYYKFYKFITFEITNNTKVSMTQIIDIVFCVETNCAIIKGINFRIIQNVIKRRKHFINKC